MRIAKLALKLTSGLVAASVLIPASAMAQAQSESEASGDGSTAAPTNRNEIVVTATKRDQTLEEIPLAVTVLTGEELEQRQVSEFADYLPSVPGVQFNPAGNVFGNSISIRGVTDGTSSFLTQQPVALVLDDTLLTLSQGAINLDYGIFGVEQISVIKGPNSTLYGASSLGGTIKVDTRRPTLDGVRADGLGAVSFTEDGGTNFRGNASISAPIVEGVLGFEATGYYISDAGYIDSPSGDENINSSETYGGRLAFRFQPTPEFTADLTAYYQKFEADDFDVVSLAGLDDLISTPRLAETFQDDEFFLATLSLNYDFGGAELTSVSSYFDRETNTQQDLSASFLNFVPGGSLGSNTLAPAEVFAQEIRLASTGESAFSWLIGGYYQSEVYSETFFLPGGAPGTFDGTLAYEYDTYAVFGELGYELADGLTATVGGRYTRYDTSVDFDNTIFFVPAMLQASDTEEDFSPRFALNYEFDAGSIYAQASRGFRLGQANVPIPGGAQNGVDEFFSPDNLWNYEIGAKTSLIDDTLFLNVAAYYIDWTDIQLTLTCVACGGFTFIDNAGDAEIKGFEIEATALLSPTTTWTAGFGFIDAELTEDVPGVANAGTRLPGSPEITWSTSLNQEFSIGENDGFLRADFLYYGPYDQAFVIGQDPLENGDYARLDLRAGITVGAVEFQVFGTNLFDERPILTRAFLNTPEVTTLQPRTIGVSVGFDY
ncbi:MAG: TonB-dependent receptor [Pseudomonadota bacterium]